MSKNHHIIEFRRSHENLGINSFVVSLSNGYAEISFDKEIVGSGDTKRELWGWEANFEELGDYYGELPFVELEIEQLVDFALDVVLAESEKLQHIVNKMKANCSKEQ